MNGFWLHFGRFVRKRILLPWLHRPNPPSNMYVRTSEERLFFRFNSNLRRTMEVLNKDVSKRIAKAQTAIVNMLLDLGRGV
jgi:hypothetical protein